MNTEKPFYKILNELCDEYGIEMKIYSFGLIKQLKKGEKIRNIFGYKFDLNSGSSVDIVNDKYAAYEILRGNKIPVIEHNMIFNPKTRKKYVTDLDLEIAKGLFLKYNKKMVIKANDSYQGKEVFLIEDKEEIEKKILGIFERNKDSISICPYEDIKNEYRVIVLDNKCLFSYKKERPVAIGDGEKNIGDFIADLNIEYPDSTLNYNYVPKKGEKVILNWKFNLSGGAYPVKIEDTILKNEIEKIAIEASKAVNIRFASIDIIENTKCEKKIMEINGTVCMNKFVEMYESGYEIAKEVYRKALIKMFE